VAKDHDPVVDGLASILARKPPCEDHTDAPWPGGPGGSTNKHRSSTLTPLDDHGGRHRSGPPLTHGPWPMSETQAIPILLTRLRIPPASSLGQPQPPPALDGDPFHSQCPDTAPPSTAETNISEIQSSDKPVCNIQHSRSTSLLPPNGLMMYSPTTPTRW
jgi:hypothetical protein